LSREDLDAERPIIREEERMRRTGGMRASEHYTKLLLKGSKYAERFPIGLMEVIDTVSEETVRAFYER
jgi:zinc protease